MTQNYGVVLDNAELDELVDRLLEADKPFGLDIESGYTGDWDKNKLALKAHHPRWLFVGFSISDGRWARYIPVNHDVGENIADKVAAARSLMRLVNSCRSVAHNMPFEQHGIARFLRETIRHELVPNGHTDWDRGYFPFEDDSMTIVQETGLHILKGLKDSTLQAFGHKMTKFDDLWDDDDPEKKKGNAKRFNSRNASDPRVIEYACEDAYWCLKLYELYRGVINPFIHEDIEMRLMPIVVRMEDEVMLLDWEKIAAASADLAEFTIEMAEDVQKDFARQLDRPNLSINLNSHQQIRPLLFGDPPEGMGLIPTKYTDTGAASTGKDALAVIARAHPTVQHLLTYRKVTKLQSAYLKRYTTVLNYAESGRAVPNHNQIGAVTGRFSVDDVSYQQWPKDNDWKTDAGRQFKFNFRDMLIAPEGSRIIGFDFSQVELRVIAGLVQERALIESFLADEDVHRRTAALMLGKPLSEVTKADRAVGKTLNFAIVYGAGPARIAAMLSKPEAPVDKNMAQGMLDAYLNAFPAIKRWKAETEYQGRMNRRVYTPFGRLVPIHEYDQSDATLARADREKDPEKKRKLKSYARKLISDAEKLSTNAPVQGGAADVMKLVIIRTQQRIDELGWTDKVRMVMTVHDALEMYVDNSISTDEFLREMQPAVVISEADYPDIMKDWPPLKADWHEGLNLGTDLFEIDMDWEAGVVRRYSQEDKSGTDHFYATYEDALARKEIGTAEAVDDTPIDFDADEESLPIILELPELTAEVIEILQKKCRKASGGETVEVRVGDDSFSLSRMNIAKVHQLAMHVKGASLYIEGADE